MNDYPCTSHVPAADVLSRCIRLTALGRDPDQATVLDALASDVAAELARPRVPTFCAVAVDPRTGAIVRWVPSSVEDPQ